MKLMRRFILATVVLSTAFLAMGQDYGILEKNFKSTFETHYEARQCGKNIQEFLKRAKMIGFDMQHISVVTIKNKGYSVFGMVNAEWARISAFDRPVAGEANWYHHVVAVDDRSFVYDFDFDIKPTILPLRQYVEKMFLIEEECETPRSGEFCAGAETKNKDYKLEWFSGHDIVHDKFPKPYWTSTLAEGVSHYKQP
jgi:hypothetical protein